jgi:hypothetical protein
MTTNALNALTTFHSAWRPLGKNAVDPGSGRTSCHRPTNSCRVPALTATASNGRLRRQFPDDPETRNITLVRNHIPCARRVVSFISVICRVSVALTRASRLRSYASRSGDVTVTRRLVAVGRESIAVGRALVLVRAGLITVRMRLIAARPGLIQTGARPIVCTSWLVGDHQRPFLLTLPVDLTRAHAKWRSCTGPAPRPTHRTPRRRRVRR